MERTQVDNIVSLAADLAGKADQIDEVLVVYTLKGGGIGALDNGLDVATAIYLMQQFQFWLLTCMAAPKK